MIAPEARASILAIGTELTTGQITNRNAAWISERLNDLGITVVAHLTVADDRDVIREALERCAAVTDLIFVTGGLGPTSDDFTRDVISEWLGKPLEYREPSWQKIVTRLTERGIRVAESNRQQCYYPLGAEVLDNVEGTANGFRCRREHQSVWVLPGPPREIAAIWKDHVDFALRTEFPGLKSIKPLSWQVIGKSEAELGEIVEAILRGSGLLTGYRAHPPYVEVKVWVPEGVTDFTYIERLESAISPWVVTRHAEDLVELFVREMLLSGKSVHVIDGVTQGLLTERLGAYLRDPENRSISDRFSIHTSWSQVVDPTSWLETTLSQANSDAITLALAGFTSDHQSVIGLRLGERVETAFLSVPYRGQLMMDRALLYATESALKQWREWV